MPVRAKRGAPVLRVVQREGELEREGEPDDRVEAVRDGAQGECKPESWISTAGSISTANSRTTASKEWRTLPLSS